MAVATYANECMRTYVCMSDLMYVYRDTWKSNIFPQQHKASSCGTVTCHHVESDNEDWNVDGEGYTHICFLDPLITVFSAETVTEM